MKKEIIINNTFSIIADNYGGWELTTSRKGMSKKTKDKPSVPITTKKTTYHPNLEQTSKAILDRAVGECESLEQIVTLLEEAKQGILSALEQKTL